MFNDRPKSPIQHFKTILDKFLRLPRYDMQVEFSLGYHDTHTRLQVAYHCPTNHFFFLKYLKKNFFVWWERLFHFPVVQYKKCRFWIPNGCQSIIKKLQGIGASMVWYAKSRTGTTGSYFLKNASVIEKSYSRDANYFSFWALKMTLRIYVLTEWCFHSLHPSCAP